LGYKWGKPLSDIKRLKEKEILENFHTNVYMMEELAKTKKEQEGM